MKVHHLDKKSGEAKITAETLEDLWHLENVLSKGDRVGSKTLRTVKVGTKEEKKQVFIVIGVEEIKLSKDINRLRLTGKIIETNAEDLVQLGRYHSLDVEPGTTIKILGKDWKSFEVKRLRQAETETRKPKVAVMVLDEDQAITALIMAYGVDYGPVFHNRARKKSEDYESLLGQYFKDLLAYILSRKEKMVIAGPGFMKDNLKDYIKKNQPELLNRLVFESVSHAEVSGITELLKKGTIQSVVGEERLEREEKLLDTLMMHIHKDDGLGAYGLEEVKKAVDMGAVQDLLVLDELLRSSKEAQSLLETADKLKVNLMIFSKDSDTGARLKGLGKIAAILRFRVQ